MGIASRVFMKATSVSASYAAEDMILLMTLHMMRMETLVGGVWNVALIGRLGVLLRYKYPPARERVFGLLR